MNRTVVSFILPLTIADEGVYNVKVDNKVAKVTLSLLPNKDVIDRITGMTSIGKVELMPDPHGVANMTQVTIELPYDVGHSMEDERNTEQFRLNLKQECIRYLNRVAEVVRYQTRRYWTTYVSGRDIIHLNFEIIDELGKGRRGFQSDAGQGFEINVEMRKESSVKSDILGMLEKEQKIPPYENLRLDAFNYFSTGRFNEAVIFMNIALEELVKETLFRGLIIKHRLPDNDANRKIDQIFSYKKKQGKSGLHRVMTVNYKEIDGRSLEDNPELWCKFNSARTVRKNVMHPYTRIIPLSIASATIASLVEIMQWVLAVDKGVA